jgi:hypothetical protein
MEQEESMTGIERIAAERKRQIEEEGWNDSFIDSCTEDELSDAALCYVFPEHPWLEKSKIFQKYWPWTGMTGAELGRVSQLARAAALIAVEIDRLQRLEEKEEQ